MSTLPFGQSGQHLASLAAGDPVGQQLDAQRAIAEQVAGVGHGDALQHSAHAGGVLLGKHLGGRHQRALVATLHSGQHGADGHQRLAGTDVALQQAMHRMRTGEVVLDLGDRSSLGGGELERQRGVQTLPSARRRSS